MRKAEIAERLRQYEAKEKAEREERNRQEQLERTCGVLQLVDGRDPWFGCDFRKDHVGRHSWEDPIDYWAPALIEALTALTKAVKK